MRRILLYIIPLIIISCTKPIILKQTALNKPGVKMYGSVPERSFYVNKCLRDSLLFIEELTTKGSYANTAPVIYDKYLFVSDLSGRVTAFDIDEMIEIGKESYKGETQIAPVLYRTRFFFVVNEYKENYATLYYYDYLTNRYIAAIEIPGAVNNEMIFDGNAVYLFNDKGVLYKINLIGKAESLLDTGTLTQCDPAMKDNFIYWGNIKGEFFKYNVESEKLIYQRIIGSGFQSGVTIVGSSAIVGDNSGTLYSVNIDNGKVNWKVATKYKIVSTAASDGDDVFIGNLNGDMFCIDFHSGEIKWQANYGGVINTTPLLFGNVLVQPNLAKKIFFIDKNNGNILKVINTERRPRMTPLYFDGRIYLGIDKGKILVYEEID